MKNKSNNPQMKQGTRTGLKVRTKLSTRILVVAAFLFILISSGLIVFINLTNSREAHAAISGDYRSAASGNWSSTSTWETYNGTSWIAAVATPTSADGNITIQNTHTVTITANVTVDQVVINTGGKIDLSSGVTLTVANGAGTDMDVSGIFKNAGSVSINSGAKILYSTGGKYQHNFTTSAGTIPASQWNPGSTCEIIGYTTNTSNPSGFSQTFQNFSWNCTNQTNAIDFGGGFPSINGDFTITSTGTSSIQFDFQGNNTTLNVGGNLYVQGGTTYGCTNGAITANITGNFIQSNGTFAFDAAGGVAYGNQSMIMNVTGSMIISGGILDLSQCTANNSSKGTGTLNLSGDLTLSGTGLLTESSAQSRGQVNFTGAAIQYLTSVSNITNAVDFTIISGSILSTGTNFLTGTGDFTLSSGAGLMMGDANGITTTGASGNVQCTGSRSYSTGADYTYDGSVGQNSGNGLPSTVHNLTLNNNSNVTLTNSTSVSNILTFTKGLCITSANTLTLGTSTAVLGTLTRVSGHVYGNFKRWIAAAATSNILFPVGTLSYYNGANISFTVAPTAGSIISTFIPTNPGTNGFTLTDAGTSLTTIGYGYWSFTAANSFAGGTYTVNLYANGFPGITDYTDLHIVRRVSGGSAWTLNGTHSVGTGSNSAPVVNRTGMTSLGHFGIGSGSTNPLPIELVYFNANINDEKQVDLSWATASEINNDYFTVERSSDGLHFTEVLRKQGAGNNTSTIYYKDIDQNPLSGISYYRLKQTDYDGHYSYSKTNSVTNKPKNNESVLKLVSISPNPFSEKFKVGFTMKQTGPVEIQLLNSSGNIVEKEVILSYDGPNVFSFQNTERLSPGIYFINLIYNDQKITQKIIKE